MGSRKYEVAAQDKIAAFLVQFLFFFMFFVTISVLCTGVCYCMGTGYIRGVPEGDNMVYMVQYPQATKHY
jgi:hypothetical protein